MQDNDDLIEIKVKAGDKGNYVWMHYENDGQDHIAILHDKHSYKQKYGKPSYLSYDGKLVYESHEIEGIFDAKSLTWDSARVLVKDINTLEEKTIEVSNWPFMFYKGDELYFNNNKIFSA